MSTAVAPAFDERAEQSVLGAILHNPNVFADLSKLRAEHFFLPAHEVIYSHLTEMFAEGVEIDSITLYSRMTQTKAMRRELIAPYLSDLLQAFKSVENVTAYADIVIDMWRIRELNGLGVRFQALADNAHEVPLALEAARNFLDEIDAHRDIDAVRFRDLYELWTADQADERPAIETPWVELNERLAGGLQRQRLYVIGARPGCGKTIMLANIATYAAQLHMKTLFFSLELSKEDLMGRILAAGARADYSEITRRKLSTATQQKVTRWAAAAAELTLEVDDNPAHTIESIMQACRIQKQRKGLDVVCIDYLQLVNASKGQNRVEAVDHIAVKARQIARQLDCVVIVAAQLNRKVDDNAGRPRLPTKSDFRESGGIEQTADVALALSRPVDENAEESPIPLMTLSILKNRTGTEGTMTLQERFNQARFA